MLSTDEIGNRIKEYRSNKKIKQKDLAKIIGIPSNTLSQYETGTIEMKASFLKDLAIKININIHWLVTGKGDMYINQEGNVNFSGNIVQESNNIAIGDNININEKDNEEIIKVCEVIRKLSKQKVKKLYHLAELENLDEK